MSLRRDNPVLFHALNQLKAKCFLLEWRDREEYATILENREEVEKILAMDGCCLEEKQTDGILKIGFEETDGETLDGNRIREKLGKNATIVFVVCYDLYQKATKDKHSMVLVTMEKLSMELAERGFSLTGKNALERAVGDLEKYSILEKDGDALVITPAIQLCLDQAGIDALETMIITPWLAGDAAEDEDEQGTEEN